MSYYLYDPTANNPDNSSQPYCYKYAGSFCYWSNYQPGSPDECYSTIDEAREAQKKTREFGFETVLIDFETGKEVEDVRVKPTIWVVSSAFNTEQDAIEFAKKNPGEWFIGKATHRVRTNYEITEV